MEKRTVFIHNTKDKLKNINDTEYRTVTFIGGNKNIKKNREYRFISVLPKFIS